MSKLVITPGDLNYQQLKTIYHSPIQLQLASKSIKKINAANIFLQNQLNTTKQIYGLNTGFGMLAQQQITQSEIAQLQKNLILSHAIGSGALLPENTVRLALALKINALSQGHSGIRLALIEFLIDLHNQNILPCIPAKGSVGASGDLAPLAYIGLLLLGQGKATVAGKVMSAKQALRLAQRIPWEFGPKEGLALINGTEISNAIALSAVFETEKVFHAAMISGAMSTDALRGSDIPFSPQISKLRGFPSQAAVASVLSKLLRKSKIRHSHDSCAKVQDPYSLRCQPQVMGACLHFMRFVQQTLVTEANAVNDNPLVFPEEELILSGGNFHAEPIAMAVDSLATVIAEIGSLAERRLALLIDPKMSSLPACLTQENGLNSGFLIAQVSAAALVSENKMLSHPCSVDSIPTSANQEDHVSMATHGAYRLLTMVENTRFVVASELLAACHGLEFHMPLVSSPILQPIHDWIREKIPFWQKDRYFAPDIHWLAQQIEFDQLNKFFPHHWLG